MKFNSEEARLAHPYAKLIPHSIWNDLFDSELTDHELEFLEFNLEPISELSEAFEEENDHGKLRLWTCVLLGHPHEKEERIHECSSVLDLRVKILFQAACVANRIDLLEDILKRSAKDLAYFESQDLRDFIQGRIKEDEYACFLYAAQAGNTEVLSWIKKHSSPEMFKEMVETLECHAFSTAAEFGHLSVLKWFKKEAPDMLEEMIIASDFYAFRAAVEFGHVGVLNWLRTEVSEDMFHDMIRSKKYEAFVEAGKNGKLKEVIEWIESYAPPAQFESILQKSLKAAKNRQEILHWLKHKDEKAFQVVPTLFKRPASDLVEPEQEDNHTPRLSNRGGPTQ